MRTYNVLDFNPNFRYFDQISRYFEQTGLGSTHLPWKVLQVLIRDSATAYLIQVFDILTKIRAYKARDLTQIFDISTKCELIMF